MKKTATLLQKLSVGACRVCFTTSSRTVPPSVKCALNVASWDVRASLPLVFNGTAPFQLPCSPPCPAAQLHSTTATSVHLQSLRSFKHISQSSLMMSTGLCSTQRRNIHWKFWQKKSSENAGFDNVVPQDAIEAAGLPDVFAEQPQEVDDYIRPDKTMFERMEDFWDWILSFLHPVDKQTELMAGVKNDLFGMDIGWGTTFVIWGIVLRLLGLPFQLYAHRNQLRLAMIGKPLGEINDNMKKVKSDRNMTSNDRRVMKDGYKRMKKALYKKHQCSQMRTFSSSFITPIMVSSYMAIRRLASYEEDLETANFFWVTDLTLPDPTHILPICCAALFLLNFELNQAMARGGRSSMSLWLRWGMRGGLCVFTYYMQSQPAALFCYWIGMSLTGVIQPMLLSNQKFRKRFNFPEPPTAAKVNASRISSFWSKIWGTKDVKGQGSDEKEESKKTTSAPSQFEHIDDYEVVFDSPAPSKGKSKK